MQAIRTRYSGPTSTKGAKVTARCEAGSVSVPWDYGLNVEDNHDKARAAMCAKLKWTTDDGYTRMVGGVFANDFYWVFVLSTDK